MKSRIFVFAFSCLCAVAGWGADAPPATQPSLPPAAPPAVSSPAQPAIQPAAQPADAPDEAPPLRDPTEADSALKRALEGMQAPGAGRTRAAAVPKINRLGLVIVTGKPPEALIEVTGAGLFFVHEGSSISAVAGDGVTLMRVVRISGDEVEIEIASQKQTMIVR